jgi:tetratricopeptide (TPR) repeat protein
MGECYREKKMVVKIGFITWILLFTINIFADTSSSYLWMKEHKGNLDVVSDKRFADVITKTVPDVMGWQGFITEYLQLPDAADENWSVLIDNRYYSGIGFKEFSLPQRVFFWCDLNKSMCAFAAVLNYENEEDTIYILSRSFCAANKLNEQFIELLAKWQKNIGCRSTQKKLICGQTELGNINEQYKSALTLFKSGKKHEAAHQLQKAIGSKPWTINNSNVTIYNDLGYFLQEAGMHQDAIDILSEVIAKFPDRIPAYLNIADAYLGLNNAQKAKENYQKYIELMTKAGKQTKIPKRVIDRVK